MKQKLTAKEVLSTWVNLSRKEQTSNTARKYAKMAGLKSMLEVKTQAWLEDRAIPFSYEKETWFYQHEPQTYRPDFNTEVTIECKGKLTKDTRKKLLSIIRCNPKKKLYMVFEKPDNKINRGSKTTYGEWADKHGIPWSAITPDLKWFKRKKKNG